MVVMERGVEPGVATDAVSVTRYGEHVVERTTQCLISPQPTTILIQLYLEARR